ncbi:MAG: coenzyme F420-0:L-glutamate ligase / coenzyme F420-1:gamma-L-glutamate ligase [Candidatus Argoarchaeum ethanivorans]|uniref:Coenzyme F420-0:L-glutamate ligase / coenzyme F420-1:gamma-L-glutamate ligase n=1 Tax=Candidatus Argoarchaeum ethanivorans TaxID=2608793 RepID=A0A8B3S3X3_9EURY|nr:MAG: coenzyme F420-0:L-glutamate ligase / coenzyme F420-1:gamma-L-glutamate ligase [Candidatus Argoarchaeum ethanivorans]
MNVCCYTLNNIPLIKRGDDIARIIIERTELKEKDIVVISSSIVAKAEQGLVRLDSHNPTTRAIEIAERNDADPRFVQAVLDNSKETLVESPFLLVELESGHICVNAGIDVSNTGDYNSVTLLPADADYSAEQTRGRLKELTGISTGVVIIDTNGRAFRNGQTGVAIGVSGIQAIHDWRGSPDLFGRTLEVKYEAILDEVAGFANLLMGEGNGATPIAVVQGLDLLSKKTSITELFRKPEEDIIRKALKRQKEIASINE